MSIRFSMMKFWDKLQKKSIKRCKYCGKRLSDTDIQYYEDSCNTCEGKIMMKLWKE